MTDNEARAVPVEGDRPRMMHAESCDWAEDGDACSCWLGSGPIHVPVEGDRERLVEVLRESIDANNGSEVDDDGGELVTVFDFNKDVLAEALADDLLRAGVSLTGSGLDVERLLSHFGHEYDMDGRQEWHSYNCGYRKTWAMYDTPPNDNDDDAACVAARAALSGESGEPTP